MGVQFALNGDVRIAYETFGAPGGEPLLLIMGLDFQMVWWPDGFCDALAERGFHVARFDNRDTGLSTHFASRTRENPLTVLFRGWPDPPYTGYDMVDDGLAVASALGWNSLHVMGGSMGSAIGMGTAILHPERVRTLTCLLTAPLRRIDTVRYLKFGTFRRFARIRQPDTDEGAVRTLVEIARLLAAPGEPFDETWARHVAEISHARSPRSRGTTQRQLAAGRAADDLPRRVGEITAPTLLVNGAEDPLVRPSAAAALARRIPGARAVVQPRMGHTIPEAVWPALADLVAAHTGVGARRVENG
jgi:pimeloyl-ACP methyl ester carboxylesterase